MSNPQSHSQNQETKVPWYLIPYSFPEPKPETIETTPQSVEDKEEEDGSRINLSIRLNLSNGVFKKLGKRFEFNKPYRVSVQAELPVECKDFRVEFRLFSLYKGLF